MKQLKIELVPSTCWFLNLRKLLKKKDWDIIRRSTYKKANNKCMICGGKGNRHPVECHEKWEYDINTKIVTLIGLESLCPSCHQVRHFGLSSLRGLESKCKSHMKKVNNWTDNEVRLHIDEAYRTFEERSKWDWDLNISDLPKFI